MFFLLRLSCAELNVMKLQVHETVATQEEFKTPRRHGGVPDAQQQFVKCEVTEDDRDVLDGSSSDGPRRVRWRVWLVGW